MKTEKEKEEKSVRLTMDVRFDRDSLNGPRFSVLKFDLTGEVSMDD
jgi:hypothetical protein